ncbi:MAG: hypothetical protein LUC18_02355 [Porphyromonadaceae bacterium]|nr:hypothetical protein [Porphyromonadaceae bacterium]
MTIKKYVGISLFLFGITNGIFSSAQSFTDEGKTYPLAADGNRYVVSGFAPINAVDDETIFANAILWTVQNVCPALREGISEVNVSAKNFTFNMTLASNADSNQRNIYHTKVKLQVVEGKLIYYLSNLQIESPAVMMKKLTPMEKLQPDKKEAHKEIMDDFVQVESQVLNKMFDFVATNQIPPITHWNEINAGRPVKDMTEVECLIAFGKPQLESESNGEIQWTYSSSFYLFFKDGLLKTFIK